MLWNAKNGELQISGKTMDYVSFGTGEKTMVMLPGVGDGLKTVRGMAAAMAANYRQLAEEYTVYIFSRVRELTEGYTTRQMAEDLAEGMELLGLRNAYVVGVSMGGMIAQFLAIDHPEQVGRLALMVTEPRANDLIREVIGRWLAMAEEGDYGGIMTDTMERSYSENYLRKIRKAYPLLIRMGGPKDFTRFRIQAEACLNHDAMDLLGQISCPTLVIGGEQDRIVGAEASRELARRIPGSKLYMYPDYGHGLYDEAKDLLPRLKHFGRKE